MIPQRLAATYASLGGGWPLVLSWEGTPHPQARPKVTRHGTYKPDAAEQRELRTIIDRQTPEILTGSLVMVAVFYLPDLRTRDTDNLVKHVLDSANGVLFKDDRQVTAQAGYVELDRERPRTIVMVGADELTSVPR